MNNEDSYSYGKEVIISEEVQYIGEGQDPAKDPAFIIWKKAYIESYEKLKKLK